MTDHPEPLSPDDPRLSAYLLGEMNAEESAAFKILLQDQPEILEHLEGLQQTSALLQDVFEKEPVPALSASQRFAIFNAAANAPSSTPQEKTIMKPTYRRRIWTIAIAVSALAVVFAIFLNQRKDSLDQKGLVAMKEAAKSVESTATYFSEDAKPFGEHPFAPFDDLKETAEVVGSYAGRSESTRSKARFAKQAQPGEPIPGLPAEFEQPPSDLNLPALADWPKNGTVAGLGAAEEQGPATPANRPIVMNPDSKSVSSTPKPDGLDRSSRITTESEVEESKAISERLARKSNETFRGHRFEMDLMDELKSEFDSEEATRAWNESYEPISENDFTIPRGEQALSTFSIDVDTASYSNMRRFLKHGQRPPVDAVRIEELVNYFSYDYAPPINGDPFSVHTEVAICPWKPEHRLVRFGLKGQEISKEQRPLSNLVFLVDVSGSMSDQNKLPLVKKALTMLANEMNENDRISLVTYAGNAGVKLPSTSGEQRSEIISAIQNLNAGGSTNGEAGIHLAYNEAIRNLIEDGSNRVILCTDGDFNVGVSGDEELVAIIQKKAKESGVFLSIFGFGMGNYKDAKLEKLADKGNGHYGYIDNEREAKKVFVEELTGTLYTIAKDVKIQVEFNPQHVGAYRLIGYENRVLAAQDFNDDTKDAGEIGAGHTVTALYEVIPAGKMPAVAEDVDRLKYQPIPESNPKAEPSPEMLTLKLRWKRPDEDISVKKEYPVMDPGKKTSEPTADTEWQAAVAAFGMVLRNSKHKGQADLRLAKELAMGSRGPDPSGLRREFIDLILTSEKIASGRPLQPAQLPNQMAAEEAEKAVSVNGKYRKLLKSLSAPQDVGVYGGFNDYGYWEGQNYGENEDLPKAHWVYVYPNWYLWGEVAKEK